MNITVQYTGDPDEEREWIFTFGGGHTHPITGESLMNRFVRLRGTWLGSRKKMVELFGQKWSMQYPTEDDAGVGQFHMTELELAEAEREAGELLATVEVLPKERAAKTTVITSAEFADELGRLLARDEGKATCPACGAELKMGGGLEHPFITCQSCVWGICPCRKREPLTEES